MADSYELWTRDNYKNIVLDPSKDKNRNPNPEYKPKYDVDNVYDDTDPPANGQGPPAGDGEGDDEDRGQWDNKVQFILSCVGLSVGLGNVWRFPYLAYNNGGAAFVLAYFILQLLIGKPMYFMELAMGQFSAKGPTKVWAMNPSAKGIGISMCMISLIVAIYYNVVMSYTLYYFFSSMQKTLPWTECKDEWIRDYNCTLSRTAGLPECTANTTAMNQLSACWCSGNSTIDTALNYQCTKFDVNLPTELFFQREVLHRSEGVKPDEMGDPLWRLALLLLLSWVVVIVCLIKGIKSSGKVVYFTATFPYILLIILLFRGALLDGARDGVEFFLVPKWKKLTEIQVWVDAAGQMFFSLSVSFGGIIMFGSYNKFKNQVYYDSLFISIMDVVTSLIGGLVVFTTLGGLAHDVGAKVEDVADGGYGLAFVVYPEALSNLEPSQLWCILFFFMLFTLGLDSEFALLETVLTCIQDEFPATRKYKSYMCVGAGVICFLLALPCVCPGGDYVVTIMDHYGSDFAVLFIACFEMISVMWVYGAMRFLKDIEYMLGSKPHGWWYWIFCWMVSAPCLLALLITYRMVNYDPPKYPSGEDFPDFAQNIGWALTAAALAPIPLWFFYMVIEGFRRNGLNLHKVMDFLFSPTDEWVPADGRKRYIAPDRTTPGQNTYPPQKTGIDNFALDYDDPSYLP